jgi:hypothetical protein
MTFMNKDCEVDYYNMIRNGRVPIPNIVVLDEGESTILGNNFCRVDKLQTKSPIVAISKWREKKATFVVSMGGNKNGACFKQN